MSPSVLTSERVSGPYSEEGPSLYPLRPFPSFKALTMFYNCFVSSYLSSLFSSCNFQKEQAVACPAVSLAPSAVPGCRAEVLRNYPVHKKPCGGGVSSSQELPLCFWVLVLIYQPFFPRSRLSREGAPSQPGNHWLVWENRSTAQLYTQGCQARSWAQHSALWMEAPGFPELLRIQDPAALLWPHAPSPSPRPHQACPGDSWLLSR